MKTIPTRIGELIVKGAQRTWCRDEGTSMDDSLSCWSMEREEDEILLLSQEIATGRDGWTDGFRCRG
jgi:hypothetical protein